MSITICESGLTFGEFEEADLFHIEKSSVYKSLKGKNEKVSTIEFIWYRKKDECEEILLVEAKSSSPKPGNQMDFEGFIDEIYLKFTHSIDLFFAIILKRLKDDCNEVPDIFKIADYSVAKIKMILVISGHKIEWLLPLSEALRKKFKRIRETWGIEIIPINHEQAQQYGLVKTIWRQCT